MNVWIKRISKIMLVAIITSMFVAAPTIYNGYKLYDNAVSQTSIEDKVADIKGQSNYVKLDEISDSFKNGIVKSEDKRFYYHGGIDPIAIGRAVVYDIKAGSFVQGGSTISQQLAKNMYFDFNKNLERKVAEVFVAVNLEKKYTKDEILELYCNDIYYGEGCNGIKEATQHYYNVNPAEMTQLEADRLIETIKCPEEFNPNCEIYQASR